MSDLDKVIAQLKRRSWAKMRASWMNTLALADLADSGLEDVDELDGVCIELLAERKSAEDSLQTSLESYRVSLVGKRPRKGPIDEKKEQEDLAKYERSRRTQIYGALRPKYDEISGVRLALFSEGLKLAQKAFHVLGCAESDAHGGNRSWSLCSAYQASLFATKALLAFCGIGFVEINGKTLVVDIYPTPVRDGEEYTVSTFSLVASRFDHRAVWQLFQRVLAITVDAPWPKDAVDKLKGVEDKHFAKQRNAMQYRNTYWPFDDLFVFLTEGEFGAIRHWEDSSGDIDFEREDISIVLGFYVTKMSLSLLHELGIASAKLRPQVERFAHCSVPERHPMYHTLFPFPTGAVVSA